MQNTLQSVSNMEEVNYTW